MNAVAVAAVFRPASTAVDPALRLFAADWALLLNCNGRDTVARLCGTLGLEVEAGRRAAWRLLDRGLIVECELTAAQYLAATAAAAPEAGETTLLALLQRGGLSLAAEPAAASSEPRPDSPTPVPFAAAQLQPAPAAVGAPPPFRPLGVRGSAPAELPRGLSLKELMAFVIGRARSREQGQLDVYRVFLRVRRDALERSGITTLRFDEDRVVRDPELLDSIREAVESVLGVSVPPSLWVARVPATAD